jgi:hypothetical protein
MNGRPLLRLLLVALAFTCLGVPVWQLTRSTAAPAPAEITSASKIEELSVTLTFSAPAESFTLTHLDKAVLAAPVLSRTWRVAIPSEGIDLLLKARWPAKTKAAAVRLQISRKGETVTDKTFWAEGGMAELVTVPGGKLN